MEVVHHWRLACSFCLTFFLFPSGFGFDDFFLSSWPLGFFHRGVDRGSLVGL